MRPKPIHFSLRPATDDDIAFIFQLRVKTMKPFFETTHGWNDVEECEKAADELNHARIVMVGRTDAGVIKVIPKATELHLHQVQILPEFQRAGFGAELIRQTIARSEKLQLPIILYVMTRSPAKRLYDRFGFVITDEYEHHCRMCRTPSRH